MNCRILTLHYSDRKKNMDAHSGSTSSWDYLDFELEIREGGATRLPRGRPLSGGRGARRDALPLRRVAAEGQAAGPGDSPTPLRGHASPHAFTRRAHRAGLRS